MEKISELQEVEKRLKLEKSSRMFERYQTEQLKRIYKAMRKAG